MTLRIDPSQTTEISRQLLGGISSRLRALSRAVRRLVVDEDALGLEPGTATPLASALSRSTHSGVNDASESAQGQRPEGVEGLAGGPRGTTLSDALNASPTANAKARVWAFKSDPEKIASFDRWLTAFLGKPLEGVAGVDATGRPWSDKFVLAAHRKGVARGYVGARGSKIRGGIPGFLSGHSAEFLRTALSNPQVATRAALLATRAFTELKGLSAEAATRLNRILTNGLLRGLPPKTLAKQMTDEIASLDRKRALVIARTEIVHSQAEGQLDALELLGEREVEVLAEWSTAGDDRVCAQCAPLDGVRFTVKEARGLIPRHPGCRCAFLPVYEADSRKRLLAAQRASLVSVTAGKKREGSRASKAKSLIDRSRWRGRELARKAAAKKRPTRNQASPTVNAGREHEERRMWVEVGPWTPWAEEVALYARHLVENAGTFDPEKHPRGEHGHWSHVQGAGAERAENQLQMMVRLITAGKNETEILEEFKARFAAQGITDEGFIRKRVAIFRSHARKDPLVRDYLAGKTLPVAPVVRPPGGEHGVVKPPEDPGVSREAQVLASVKADVESGRGFVPSRAFNKLRGKRRKDEFVEELSEVLHAKGQAVVGDVLAAMHRGVHADYQLLEIGATPPGRGQIQVLEEVAGDTLIAARRVGVKALEDAIGGPATSLRRKAFVQSVIDKTRYGKRVPGGAFSERDSQRAPLVDADVKSVREVAERMFDAWGPVAEGALARNDAIYIVPGERAHNSSSGRYFGYNDERTFAHELAHSIETHLAAPLEKLSEGATHWSQDLNADRRRRRREVNNSYWNYRRKQRAKGERAVKVGPDPGEIGHEDRWAIPYMGKVYGSGHTEIVSVMSEPFGDFDTARWSDQIKKDPTTTLEFVGFMKATIDGEITRLKLKKRKRGN